MNDFDELGDTVAIEMDRRKLQKLVDDGKITQEELANARIVNIVCPNNSRHGLTPDGQRCGICGAEPVEAE